MFKFLVLTTLLALGGVVNSVSDSIDGTPIQIEDAPYIIILEKSINGTYDGFCSGTILSNRWIITSAQCWKDIRIYGHGYEIRAGTANSRMGGMLYNVIQVARWSDSTVKGIPKSEHDIALVKVDPALELNSDTMHAVLLPESNYTLEEGTRVTLSSWGRQTNLPPDQNVLYRNQIKVIGNDNCKNSYENLPSKAKLICTESISETEDFPHAEWGDPLTYGHYIVGIVLRNSASANDQESIVYTEIAPYVNWINGTTHGELFNEENDEPQY